MKFIAGLALGAFLAVLLLMPQVWKKEPEPDYREDDDGIQPADPWPIHLSYSDGTGTYDFAARPWSPL